MKFQGNGSVGLQWENYTVLNMERKQEYFKTTSVVFFDVINILYSLSKKLKKVAIKNIFRHFLRIYK